MNINNLYIGHAGLMGKKCINLFLMIFHEDIFSFFRNLSIPLDFVISVYDKDVTCHL